MVCYWLWVDSGVGEANFVYFQCLAYNVLVGMLFVEFCSASLRRDKVLRVTEKLLT
jgi:phosphatidylinositol glycan class U